MSVANQNIYAASDLVLQSGAVATGNGTLMPVGGAAGVTLQVAIAGTATVTPQGTVDTSNFVALQALNLNTGTWATTITASGLYWIPLPGVEQFRANITSWVSGAVTVTAKAVPVAGPDPPDLSTGTIGAVNQGAAAAVGSAWPVYPAGSTNNGLSKGKVRDLAGTVQSIKASAGTLYMLTIENSQAAKAFVQLFDAATGGVTLGTTNPDWEFEVAANSTYTLPIPPQGVPFGTAISIASTTAEKGNTGSSAGVEPFWLYQ